MMRSHLAPAGSMPRAAAVAVVLAVLCALLPAPTAAQGLLRDAGSEHALDRLARPVLTAASLPARRMRVLIVDDLTPNAFVVDRRAVYLHAGLILELDTAAQLQAVIAHEAAHIANGHFARRRLNAQAARRNALIGLAAGVAAGAATGNPGAGAGIALGTQGSALGVFLGHTREEEAAADRSGLRYLALAGIDPAAMAEVLETFARAEAVAAPRGGAYAQTHPLTRARQRAVAQAAAELEPARADRSGDGYWFDRVQAKLAGYLRSPAHTFARYPDRDASDPARIARVMAHHKRADLAAARREMAALLEARPEDPYLHDLAGWIEIESARVGPAIEAYARAAELAPSEPLILAGYGRALLARNTPQTDVQALEVLEAARARDRRDVRLLRNLALAYSRAGDQGNAALATAERHALTGDWRAAEVQARRAEALLPTGSPGWSRAQDVLRAAERSQKD